MKRLLWLIPIAAVVGLDQLTKWLAVVHLKKVDTIPIFEDALHLTYLENRGAAFGMLKDHRWVFMVASTLAVVAIIVAMLVYFEKLYNPLLYTGLAFIAGGGIGNMIDRVALGYVVDFIDFRLIDFAIFNVADSFVCVGCALVILQILLGDLKDKHKNKTGDHSSQN